MVILMCQMMMVFDRQVVDAAISYLISLVEQVLPIFK
jgi:hypothetical protein